MFRLTNATCSFELELLRGEPSENGYGSIVFWASTKSKSFSGEARVWVFKEQVEQFCKALVNLNNTLKGEASLKSISSEEILLKLESVNSRGGLGISGNIGNHFMSDNTVYWHSVYFWF
jgi:hypothetical protein